MLYLHLNASCVLSSHNRVTDVQYRNTFAKCFRGHMPNSWQLITMGIGGQSEIVILYHGSLLPFLLRRHCLPYLLRKFIVVPFKVLICIFHVLMRSKKIYFEIFSPSDSFCTFSFWVYSDFSWDILMPMFYMVCNYVIIYLLLYYNVLKKKKLQKLYLLG